MDTRLLEDALILLEERSLSAAALRRNMTQPAFSRRIRALEQWIGEDMLTRHANRIVLSPTLVQNESKIRALLAHLQQLHGHLRRAQGHEDTLVLVTQHALSASAVPDIVQRANSGERNWRVRLRTQNQDIAMSMFLRHEADVLVAFEHRDGPQAPFDDSVARYVWRRDALIPVIGSSINEKVSDEGILNDTVALIVYPADSHFGQIITNHEKRAQLVLSGPIAVESAFSVGVSELVLAGVGAAWLPHSLVNDEIISEDVTILSSAYGRIPMDIVLYVHSANDQACAFQDTLFKAV